MSRCPVFAGPRSVDRLGGSTRVVLAGRAESAIMSSHCRPAPEPVRHGAPRPHGARSPAQPLCALHSPRVEPGRELVALLQARTCQSRWPARWICPVSHTRPTAVRLPEHAQQRPFVLPHMDGEPGIRLVHSEGAFRAQQPMEIALDCARRRRPDHSGGVSGPKAPTSRSCRRSSSARATRFGAPEVQSSTARFQMRNSRAFRPRISKRAKALRAHGNRPGSGRATEPADWKLRVRESNEASRHLCALGATPRAPCRRRGA